MGSSPDKDQLSALQRDLLEAFFERERRFFLTGGGALAGFHFGHRPSDDVDLFTLPPTNLDDGERALRAAAGACGATLVPKDSFPEFRRFIAERGADKTVVDLAVDRAPQVVAEKIEIGRVPNRKMPASTRRTSPSSWASGTSDLRRRFPAAAIRRNWGSSGGTSSRDS